MYRDKVMSTFEGVPNCDCDRGGVTCRKMSRQKLRMSLKNIVRQRRPEKVVCMEVSERIFFFDKTFYKLLYTEPLAVSAVERTRHTKDSQGLILVSNFRQHSSLVICFPDCVHKSLRCQARRNSVKGFKVFRLKARTRFWSLLLCMCHIIKVKRFN